MRVAPRQHPRQHPAIRFLCTGYGRDLRSGMLVLVLPSVQDVLEFCEHVAGDPEYAAECGIPTCPVHRASR